VRAQKHNSNHNNSRELLMRFLRILIPASILLMFASLGSSQEHWTEGPVWSIDLIRTADGHFDDYMKYVRQNLLVINNEAKKQGLILDFKVFVKNPTSPNDWDVALATLYPSYGKALDYSKADEEKYDAISAAQYKTADRDKQRSAIAYRLSWRTYLGTDMAREVNLKPVQ